MTALIIIGLALNISLNNLQKVKGLLPVKKDLPFYMGKFEIGENLEAEVLDFYPVDSIVFPDTVKEFEGPYPLSGEIFEKLERIKKYPIYNLKIEKQRNKVYVSFVLYPYRFQNKKIIKYTRFVINIHTRARNERKSLFNVPFYAATLDEIVISKRKYFYILEEYKHFREKFGFRIKLFDVDSILENIEGSDAQEKVRNFIKKIYLENGISYVFIVGDINEVPIRYVLHNSFWYRGYLPTTLYYADLDGTWDGDKDGIYGEGKTDSIDGMPDVIVGWLPVSQVSILKNYIHRLKEYENSYNAEYIGGNFLFVGSSITYPTDGYGPQVLEWIEDSAFTDDQSIYKLYYPDSGGRWLADEELSKISFMNQMQLSRYAGVIHYDHGSFMLLGTGWLNSQILNIFDIHSNSVSANIPFFFLSPSCDIGAFDQESIIETWLEATGGPIASIVNVRTGWTIQNYQLLNILTSLIKKKVFTVGEAWLSAMAGYLYFRENFILMGDPLVRIWTQKPESLNVSFEIEKDSIIFYVKNKNNTPVIHAKVSIFNDTEKKTGFTDKKGYLKLPCIKEGNVKISVFHPDYYLFYDSLRSDYGLKIVRIQTDSDIHKYDTISIYIYLKNEGTEGISGITIKADSAEGINFLRDATVIETINPKEIKRSNIPLKAIIQNENAHFILKITTKKPYIKKNTFVTLPVISDSFVILGGKFYVNKKPKFTVIDSLTFVNFSSKTRSVEVEFMGFRFPVTIEGKSVKFLDRKEIPILLKEFKLNVYEKGRKIYEKSFNISKNYSDADIFIKDVKNELNLTTIFLNSNIPFNCVVIIKDRKNNFVYPELFNQTIISLKNLPNNFVAEIILADISGNLIKKITTDTLYPVYVYKNLNIPMESYINIDGFKLYAVASPKIGDLDGDGLDDIVIPSQAGEIFVLYGSGEFDTFDISGNKIEGTPAIYDVDEDGKEEVILGKLKGNSECILILDRGNMKISKGKVSTDVSIINDSFPIVYSTQSRIHIINENFSEKPGFPVNIEYSGTGVAINDINKNYEEEEIIYTAWLSYVGIISQNGEKIRSIDLPGISEIPPVVGDINSDSASEIIIATRDKGIFILDKDLNILKNISNINSVSQPVIADIDLDSKYEILVYAADGKLYAINEEGEVIFTFNTYKYWSRISPLVVDIYGDKKKEIILLTSDGELYVLNAYGIPYTGFPVRLFGYTNSTPLIKDIDQDGRIEIALKAGGNFYILKLGNYKQSYDWGEKYQNKRNTSSIYIDKRNRQAPGIQGTFNSHTLLWKFNEVSVFDVSGRKILKIVCKNPGLLCTKEFKRLKKGVYFIRLKSEKGERKIKIVKIK